MKVKRTAERLAHIISEHQRALVQLRRVSSPVASPELSVLRPPESSAASLSTASLSTLRPCELRRRLRRVSCVKVRCVSSRP